MKILKIGLPIVLVLGLITLIAAPIGPVPGLFIGGTPVDAPQEWRDTSGIDEIRLKVPGFPPRVVIIWVIDHEGELYVVGGSDSGWVERIGNGGPVELRLGDDTYALNASLLSGPKWRPVLEAWVAKYEPNYPDIVAGFPSIEDAPGAVSVFHLNRS
ncbi:MAG: hypothetical protein AAF430_18180 [Myxococcota bacterium]